MTLQKAAIDKVINKGEIRIAYNWCMVMRRVDVTQCYRYWSYGHRAMKCGAMKCGAMMDRSKDCRKCGETGHQWKGCTRNKRWPVCDKKGHSAGTGAWPKTRHALKDARWAASTPVKDGRKGHPREDGNGPTTNGTINRNTNYTMNHGPAASPDQTSVRKRKFKFM